MSELDELLTMFCDCVRGKVQPTVIEEKPIDKIVEEQMGRPTETTLLYVNAKNKITSVSVKDAMDRDLIGNVEIVVDIVGDIKKNISKREWKHLQDKVFRIKKLL